MIPRPEKPRNGPIRRRKAAHGESKPGVLDAKMGLLTQSGFRPAARTFEACPYGFTATIPQATSRRNGMLITASFSLLPVCLDPKRRKSIMFASCALPIRRRPLKCSTGLLSRSSMFSLLQSLFVFIHSFMFRTAQRDGIWAWDCKTKQAVLVFPVVLALLGDNPMHSEMASHIGLQGRLFCRVCKVSRGNCDHFPSIDEEDGGDDDDAESVRTAPGSRPSTPTPGSPSVAHNQALGASPGIAPHNPAIDRSLSELQQTLHSFTKVSEGLSVQNHVSDCSCVRSVSLAPGRRLMPNCIPTLRMHRSFAPRLAFCKLARPRESRTPSKRISLTGYLRRTKGKRGRLVTMP